MDYCLSFSCPNRPGIIARVTSELAGHGADVLDAHQFCDAETNTFFMRVVFRVPEGAEIPILRTHLSQVAFDLGMDWMLRSRDQRRKVLLLVSKFDHCLIDLLYRWRIGELNMDVVGIISNHPREIHENTNFGDVPFHYLPVTKETKDAQEAQIKEIVNATGAELVILARYMQILSDDLASFLSGRCINIHHSFLPGFKGAKPYH